MPRKRKTTTSSSTEQSEPRKTRKIPVKVRWFEPRMMKFGRVSIEVLVPSKETVVEEEAETPLDALINVSERISSNRSGIVMVEVSDTARRVLGYMQEGSGRIMLFPRPARLLGVGVLTVEDAIRKGSSGGTALFKLPADSIRIRRVKGEVYVYEGRVEAPDDAYILILDTDLGRRYVRLARDPIINPLVQHVLTRPEPDEESRDNGRGRGEDSSPSE